MTDEVQHTVFIPAITLRYIGSFSIGPDQPRQLEAQIGVSHSATQAEIDEKLDMVARAFDRQAAYYKLRQAQEMRDQELVRAQRLEAHIVEDDEKARRAYELSNRKGSWTPDKRPVGEQRAQDQRREVLQGHIDAARRADELMKELKGVLNGAAHISPDSDSGMRQG